MTRRVIGALVVVAVVAVVSVWVSAQSARTALEGAWVLQEMSYAKPPAFKLNKPIGMLIISGRHFATVP